MATSEVIADAAIMSERPFDTALRRYIKDLDGQEKEDFQHTTMHDVWTEVRSLETRHFSLSRTRCMSRCIEPLVEFVARYANAIDTMVQYDVSPSALIWGTLKMVGRILNRPETPSRYAARVFDVLQNLNRLFSSYSNLALGYYIPYQHFLHGKRQRRLEVEEDEKGLLGLSVDLQNTAGSERLFKEAELTSLVMQSRDWIEKIKEAVSFAMLGIADLQSLKLFGESPTAKRTGLDKVAVRQVMNRSQVVDDLEPLQGHLEGSPYTSPKSGLQLMRFLSECEPEGLDVVVEFKSYRQPILGQSSVNPSELAEQRLHSTNLVKRTIRNLAALLYKSSFGMDSADSILARSYPVLCTFNCIGYLDQPEEEHMAFIFQLPTMPSTTVLENIFTLHAFIDRVDETKNPAEALPLEQRFLLAHSLCLTVLNLHSSGWVHKNIRSQNIVLFPTPLLDAPNESRSTKTSRFVPYLKGFEFSRPALGRSDGLSTFDMMSNLYRHPERQGKPTANFSKEHDLYALGVVLLEVGIGKTVTKRYQPRLEASKHSGKYLTPEDIRDKFIVKMAEMELPKAMGSKYTRAVVRCLRGDFGVERDDKQQTELGLTFQELVIDAVEEGLQL